MFYNSTCYGKSFLRLKPGPSVDQQPHRNSDCQHLGHSGMALKDAKPDSSVNSSTGPWVPMGEDSEKTAIVPATLQHLRRRNEVFIFIIPHLSRSLSWVG